MILINERNTVQKQLILDAVRGLDSHPTADEIYERVAVRCPSISKGTVYRNLNRLADDGEILRVAVANAPDRFDRTTGDHCHCRCLTCGRVFDYKALPHIELSRTGCGDFEVTGCDVVFRGYCKSCKGGV